MSFQREGWQKVDCLGKNCAFADAAGECFIRQALECYVSRERTAAAEEGEYIRLAKNGSQTPITFKDPYKIF
jgi:hypothetical protein